jgi:predicted branched-subunit amino acid permease
MKLLTLDWRVFRQGFRAVIPLWLAAAPVALAFSIAAWDAGLNPWEMQLMSLTIYSASAQIAMAQFLSTGTPTVTILATTVAVNLHFLLYGLSLTKHIKLSRLERVIAAYVLTDATYAITIAAGTSSSFSFLFGAGVSMFLAWNLLTALARLIVLPSSASFGFAAPLTFFILLISTMKTRLDLGIALFSAIAALLCTQFGSAALVIVGISGALLGAWLSESRNKKLRAVSDMDVR